MARTYMVLSQAAATNRINYLTCSLCTNHTNDHIGWESLHQHVDAEVGPRLPGVGFTVGRDYFRQVLAVSREVAMRFNHLHGTIACWSTTAGMRLAPPPQLPDFQPPPPPADDTADGEEISHGGDGAAVFTAGLKPGTNEHTSPLHACDLYPCTHPPCTQPPCTHVT